eukprot:11979476-Alexandrium_andersonii.AAC.1
MERALNDAQGWAKTRRLAEVNRVFSCDCCAYTCASRQQLATRALIVHGVRRQCRDCIDSEHCLVCVQHFHTRVRVITHLEARAQKCRTVVARTMPKLPADA